MSTSDKCVSTLTHRIFNYKCVSQRFESLTLESKSLVVCWTPLLPIFLYSDCKWSHNCFSFSIFLSEKSTSTKNHKRKKSKSAKEANSSRHSKKASQKKKKKKKKKDDDVKRKKEKSSSSEDSIDDSCAAKDKQRRKSTKSRRKTKKRTKAKGGDDDNSSSGDGDRKRQARMKRKLDSIDRDSGLKLKKKKRKNWKLAGEESSGDSSANWCAPVEYQLWHWLEKKPPLFPFVLRKCTVCWSSFRIGLKQN